jgi:hypothetical protein
MAVVAVDLTFWGVIIGGEGDYHSWANLRTQGMDSRATGASAKVGRCAKSRWPHAALKCDARVLGWIHWETDANQGRNERLQVI